VRIAILTLVLVSMLGGTASAGDTGWVRHRDHFVLYRTALERPEGDHSSLYVQLWWDARQDAIRDARRANDLFRRERARVARERLRAQEQQPAIVQPESPAPVPEHHVGVKGIICSVFGSRCSAALSVVACETGGTFDPAIVNPSSGAAGLFQLMPFWWQGEFNPFDPWLNAQFAYGLSDGGTNWGPWVCKP
jgi:hypothetical protein